MPSLILFDTYSRKDVHNVFAPYTRFTRGSGTWGILGIVPIPERPNDFVFFVTFGQKQGRHRFDEGITENGVLSWQSQPRQTLHNAQIQQFIDHDELENTIYLFLRTDDQRQFTYLGRLKYLLHDAEREKPVYFQWQLLDWPIPTQVVQDMGLVLQQVPKSGLDIPIEEVGADAPSDSFIQEGCQPYNAKKRRGVSTRTFRARKAADYAEVDAKNRALGQVGEIFVLKQEQQFLIQAGRSDLAEKVRHVAEVEGDGAGYDILSFELDETLKYIEVKTTRGPKTTAFFMSANELEFARQHSNNYFLYRVYNYDLEINSGERYILHGNPEDLGSFELTPTNYRVRPT